MGKFHVLFRLCFNPVPMKKLSLLILTLTISLAAFSQIPQNTLGVRLGGSYRFDIEASYQRICGKMTRIELGAGVTTGPEEKGFTAAGTFQWAWDLNNGFYVFFGPGMQTGTRSKKYYLGAHVQTGFEYIFSNAPLQLGIDTRPVVGIMNASNAVEVNINIFARYAFGNKKNTGKSKPSGS